MSDLSRYIMQLREQFIQSGRANNYEEINCGDCVDFAEEIEAQFTHCVPLSNDHFIQEREDSDGWNGDEQDQWSEKWLKEYNSLPPAGVTIPELTKQIGGYHCWIYSEGKHYDAECPEGVENFFELPFFKRHLNNRREEC